MKIKEGLVYNKFTGEIIGLINQGNINDDLVRLEHKAETHPPVATHVLVLMVRGIFFTLSFPYAHFATSGITGDLLYPIVWEAIRRLEACGFKVLCITADGASPNRKFFRIHGKCQVAPDPPTSSVQQKKGKFELVKYLKCTFIVF